MAANASARVSVPSTRAERTALLRGIYLIVNDGPRARDVAAESLEAGVRIVQYRAKRGIVDATLRALRELTRASGALLIVNDDVDAAVAFDCDGVHLGPQDAGFTNVSRVRDAIGARLIGLSCGTVTEMTAAYASGADYAGVGSVYATASKDDAGEPIGVDGLRSIAAAAPIPVAAIGGITAKNLRAVRSTGVAMAAVISAIADAPRAVEAARALVEAWH